MPQFDVDLFTIGAGSGGVRAARMAAAAGARSAIAEEDRLGGTCVNVGCVPKKLMVSAAQLGQGFADGVGFGWERVSPRHDWNGLLANIQGEVGRLNDVYGRLLDSAGVSVHRARARLGDAHTVEVDGRTITARHILVATGSRPRRLEVPGADAAIFSDAVFTLPERPRRLLIVGGGYIAVEFAGVFSALGSEVTLIHRNPLFLSGFDDDLRTALAAIMTRRTIDLRFDTLVREIGQDGKQLVVTTNHGDRLPADQVLVAIGREPNTDDLGLEAAGVERDEFGAIRVDPYSRTSVESIWAVGDCTNRMNLTPVAISEAMALVRTLFHDAPTAMDYRAIPSAVFSQPPLATVGLTEVQAREQSDDVVVYRSQFRPMQHTLSGRQEQALMKLVVDGRSDRVLGVHILGPDAAEIIQGFAVALRCGATKSQLDSTVGVHPTLAEELVTLRTAVG